MLEPQAKPFPLASLFIYWFSKYQEAEPQSSAQATAHANQSKSSSSIQPASGLDERFDS